MNAHTILTPSVAALDAAQMQRADALAPDLIPNHLDHDGQYFLMSYYSGVLMTCGAYGSPRDAMNACDDVAAWIEYCPFKWRSDDGRRLIGQDFTPAERRKA